MLRFSPPLTQPHIGILRRIATVFDDENSYASNTDSVQRRREDSHCVSLGLTVPIVFTYSARLKHL